MEKIETRRKWNEIKKKGKTVLQLLDTIVTVGIHRDAEL